ncbi:complement C1q-like protein 4 [Ruditapes philippinarum]|uniref:complement C1q-like protein 4 n=1 Tax=Ruditapes philippinarum TaxID=129788 RepID=UPI00295C0E08|nr:complement C1q-like protein 4 [Ruditapes philippinarum]
MNRAFFSVVIYLMLHLSKGTHLGHVKSKDNGKMFFKTILVNYQDEITSLKNNIAALEERVTKLEESEKSSHVMLSNQVEKTGSGIDTDHKISKRAIFRRRIRKPEVAFHATLTKPSATVKMLETIVFNNVITNIGHAYNHHTGVFTAPIHGTYTFNTDIVAERGHYIEASIVRNGEVAVSAISDHRFSQDGKHFTTWDQGNAVAILRLNKGDKVAVTLQWPEGSHAIHGRGKSSFSGYLLR